MSDHTEHAQDGHGHEDHGLSHVSLWQQLVAVWIGLMTLTGITVWTANINFHGYDLFIAMIIACTKAGLVCLFFMHLAYDRALNRLVFFSCLLFVAFFLFLSILDTSQNMPGVDKYQKDVPVYESAMDRKKIK